MMYKYIIDSYLNPKIADFDLSKQMHINQESKTMESEIGLKGTYQYYSPELLRKTEYSQAGDVYAFVLIVYEIIILNFHLKKKLPLFLS